MSHEPDDTAELMDRAGRGDSASRQRLLARHRQRLLRMVDVRLDRRLAARLDPSDVVQEILIDANQHLDDFLKQRPIPFYAWLRQLAWARLVDLHRRHVGARRRSVTREERGDLALPDESVLLLAQRLFSSHSSPSRRLIREEEREELRAALTALPSRDREVLVMRHMEQMEIGEIASVLGITVGAVKARHLRALLRLRVHLEDQP
jgi:RNA polymerase sigma-70 factor, ECF subfamily